MGTSSLTQNPFAILTFIAAPAILTNAASVMAMSTINRMLRTRERMQQLLEQAEADGRSQRENFVAQVNRVELQGELLLKAMAWIYTAFGGFAAATLVTLLGALAGQFDQGTFMPVVAGAGLVLGLVGVTGLVVGAAFLFRATRLSLVSIQEEAELIRKLKRNPARD